MSDAIITVILTQVATILEQQIRQEVRLISGVEKQIKKLKSEFEAIKAVLVDAEKRQVKEEAVKVWLEKLRDIAYETEDVLSEWITAMQKAEIEGALEDKNPTKKVQSLVSLSCFGLNRVATRRDIALKIKKINERLVDIANEKDRYKFEVGSGRESPDRPKTTSFVDLSEVEGRGVDKNTLMGKLCARNDRGLNVISIVGLGGIGKTTLAQMAYNDGRVVKHFDMRIWVCVSDPFDEVRVAKAILEHIDGSAPYLFELETLARKIRFHIGGKRFLLVLDDVWMEDFRKWEHLFNSFKTGAVGSTILVTTRLEKVAKAMNSSYELRLGQLSEHDAWAFFKKIAFFERKTEECERLEGVGRRIAEQCKGLPLTLRNIGSLMRFKKTLQDWEDVLKSDFWELKEAEGLSPPLMLSYYDLPSNTKRCFSFCAFFPKDHTIEAKHLIQLWMAQGYLSSPNESVDMEIIGEEILENLAMRSFFQDLEKEKNGNKIVSVKMHDVVHDFARYLSKNECIVVDQANGDLERKMSSQNRARHLTVVRGEDTSFPKVLNVEKLFTFWVQSFYDSPPIVSQLDPIDPELFRGLLSLRALDLSRNRIGEVPKEIGCMFKLKYLNFSHNPFWELPSDLCDLYNLQTLKLSSCDHLRKLPQDIGKLENLRHLEIDMTDSLKTLPKGIGKLHSLQTLSKFIVVRGNDNERMCGIQDLANLNNLRGCLRIEGLGFVNDANEAKRARLHLKTGLTNVEMDFSPSLQNRSHDKVIEALEVHENVQSLQISSFGGNELPKWIIKLASLKRLNLQDCHKCTHLPSLGSLPSLATLHLEGMNGVKILDLNQENTTNGGGDGSATSSSIIFPKLKKLKIAKMDNLEELHLIKQGDCKIMPRLKCLKISRCSELKALPAVLLQESPIGKLRVDDCRLLKQKYNTKNGEDRSKISHIQKIRIS